jgi:hypothetical protein
VISITLWVIHRLRLYFLKTFRISDWRAWVSGKPVAGREPVNDLAELRAGHEAFWMLKEIDRPLLKIPAHAEEDHPYVSAPSVAEAIAANENACLTPDLI